MPNESTAAPSPGPSSDLRYGTARSKVAFLFVRVGLAGADAFA